MDNAPKIAEVAWEEVYFFKIDHKNGYLHVPMHKKSQKSFGIFWKGKYYVFAVLPFWWKSSKIHYYITPWQKQWLCTGEAWEFPSLCG
jgi:hypothetical protein